MPLPIIYQDEHYVAVHKPSGLLVHRTAISRDRVFALQMLRDQLGRHVFPVHRLDRATSGILMFALSAEAAAPLANQFEFHQVTKRYLAIVRGYAPDEGDIDSPLKNAERGLQRAHTRFETLGRVELPVPVSRHPTARFSLVSVTPTTGRRHQIRRHLARINNPVIGDVKHGDRHQNYFIRDTFGVNRLLLAATELRFRHPFTDQNVALTAAPSEEFHKLVTNFGWRKAINRADQQQADEDQDHAVSLSRQ